MQTPAKLHSNINIYVNVLKWTLIQNVPYSKDFRILICAAIEMHLQLCKLNKACSLYVLEKCK